MEEYSPSKLKGFSVRNNSRFFGLQIRLLHNQYRTLFILEETVSRKFNQRKLVQGITMYMWNVRNKRKVPFNLKFCPAVCL